MQWAWKQRSFCTSEIVQGPFVNDNSLLGFLVYTTAAVWTVENERALPQRRRRDNGVRLIFLDRSRPLLSWKMEHCLKTASSLSSSVWIRDFNLLEFRIRMTRQHHCWFSAVYKSTNQQWFACPEDSVNIMHRQITGLRKRFEFDIRSSKSKSAYNFEVDMYTWQVMVVYR